MSWTPADAQRLYHVDAWGAPYFFINEDGHAAVRPVHGSDAAIDIQAVVQELQHQGISFPVLLRFQDLLQTRVVELNEAFRTAIAESGYQNRYNGVYPIKVNQLREVVEDILDAGAPYGFGLECGSKTELVATLPRLEDDATPLICNGYKDLPMLRLMLSFQRLGKNVLPVIEKYAEFEALLDEATALSVTPQFGVRVRLSAGGSGKWAESGGDFSKFGVSTPELLQLIQRLEDNGLQDAFRLLHFHLGSQISDIQALKTAIKEITRVYAHLIRHGIPVQYLDVGGGLGINYEAGSLGGNSSIDYSIQEYANAVVYAVQEVCDHEDVPHPILVSENGRALTAHHSVLVAEALSATTRPQIDADFAPDDDHHATLHALHDLLTFVQHSGANSTSLRLPEVLEAYHDAVEQRQQADTLFSFGYLSLEQKALAERLFWSVCRAINAHVHRADPEWLPQELAELDDRLVDQYLCDFSVFQSLMDYWSIGQRFPILPLDRLDEEPTRRATLVDLTCDSDGKISRFVAPDEDKRYLDVHPLRDDERYFLGIFLVGAYQDILGDTHNLFGSTTEAHIYVDEDEPDGFYIEKVIPGTTVEQMLAHVQYFPNDLERRMDAILRAKAADGVIRPKAATQILQQYRRFFDDQTYYTSSKE